MRLPILTLKGHFGLKNENFENRYTTFVNNHFMSGLAKNQLLGPSRFGEKALSIVFHFKDSRRENNDVYI